MQTQSATGADDRAAPQGGKDPGIARDRAAGAAVRAFSARQPGSTAELIPPYSPPYD